MTLSSAGFSRQRLHRAAQVEDAANRVVAHWLRRRGWRPRVLGYCGYGTSDRVRVLGRVLLAPPRSRQRDLQTIRGWRRFLAITAPGVSVVIEIGDSRHRVTTARGGYIDAVLPAGLEPGWSQVELIVEDATPTPAPVRILGNRPHIGIISDIDDTVMITALPRPFVALWNTFGRREAARRPVPGMAALYRMIASENPNCVVVYVSTGPWNVAPAIDGFLSRHGYPPGPLLLTDWGPTTDGWFRSGRAHKRTELHRLITELPQVSWILVGDDGQHDPELYCEVAHETPDRVRAIAIRELTAAQQIRTHGLPEPPTGKFGHSPSPPSVPEVRGPNGMALLHALRKRSVLLPPPQSGTTATTTTPEAD
jgi:phosphatidate phosphatase APP1